MLKRWLREPLLHFLLGGALLFVVFGAVSGGRGFGTGDDVIVVDERRIALLAETFERTWMRPPTAAELDGLVDDHVTEEILYREALALGLDRDDLVVRRRMRQKMEFLNAGIADARDPTDDELRGFLAAHPERFRRPTRLSFEQVYLDPRRPGPGAETRAAALLEQLAGEPDREQDREGLGDATLLPRRLERASPREIAGRFGDAFADAVVAAPPGAWTGPVSSGFGLHLVRVTAREPSRQPDLDEARREVEREWRATRRREAEDRFHRALRERYRIEIRRPEPASDPAVAARTP